MIFMNRFQFASRRVITPGPASSVVPFDLLAWSPALIVFAASSVAPFGPPRSSKPSIVHPLILATHTAAAQVLLVTSSNLCVSLSTRIRFWSAALIIASVEAATDGVDAETATEGERKMLGKFR